MTNYEKTIAALALGTQGTRTATIVIYKRIKFAVYVDGGGLDIITLDKEAGTVAQEVSQDLFNKIFDDNYSANALSKSIIKAGAVITPMKSKAGYHVYKIDGVKELWRGKIEQAETHHSYRAGYIADLDNLDYAIEEAAAEMRSLMAEAN